MVQFNQPVQPAQDPNYMFYSRAPSRWEFQTDRTPEQAAAGLGNLLTEGAKAGDDINVDNIKQGLYQQIDAIRAQHGGELAPDQVAGFEKDNLGQAGPQVPSDVTNSLGTLQKMKLARDAGNGMSDSQYYAQLEATVKQMRNRYPAYRDQIDTLVSHITGVTPANALRRSVLADMTAMSANSQSAASKLITQYREDLPYLGRIDPAGVSVDQYASNWQSLQLQISKMKSQDSANKSLDLQYTAAQKGSENRTMLGTQALTGQTRQMVGEFTTSALGALSKESQDLTALGASASPAAVQALSDKIGVVKQQMTEKFRAMVRMKYPDLPPDKVDALYHSEIELPLDTMQKNLGLKQVGVANAAANIIQMRDSQIGEQLERIIPEVSVMKELNRAGGNQVSADYYHANQGSVLPKAQTFINNYITAHIRDTTSGQQTVPITTIFKGIRDAGEASGDTNKRTIQTVLTQAQDKDPEVASRAIQMLYNDPLLFAKTSEGDRNQLYNMLGSPAFTAKMATLEKSKPGAAKPYFDWMEQNFGAVAHEGISNLQNAITSKYGQVDFDPKTMQFRAHSTAPYQDNPDFKSTFGDPFEQTVTPINQSLSLIKPVLEARYGADAPAQLIKLLGQSGVNFSAGKQDPLAETILNKTQEFLGRPIDVRGAPGVGYTGSPGPLGTMIGNGARGALSVASPGSISLNEGTPPEGDIHGERQKYAFNFFKGQGYTDAQAAGIVGGLHGETAHLNPTQIHDGGIGLGIAGWNGERLAALRQFATEHNLPVHDLNTQLQFVNYELHNGESKAGDLIRKATTPEEAGQAMLQYERPKDYNVPGAHPERARYAKQFYQQYAMNLPPLEEEHAIEMNRIFVDAAKRAQEAAKKGQGKG